MDTRSKTDIDRLTELANIGAGHAAGAFAQLVGRTIWTEVPMLVQGEAPGTLGAPSAVSEDWCTGVFFEFDGCVDALVGILFHGPSSEILVRRIVGIDSGELAPTLIESALMEVGNILASHVASAIADTLRARLLPSIPSLAMEDAEGAFSDWVEERVGGDALRIESGLSDESGELRGKLILVPTGADADEKSRRSLSTPEL